MYVKKWMCAVVLALLTFRAAARAERVLVTVEEVQHLRHASGIIYDPSGTALPGAEVHLVNHAGDVISDTKSGLDGHFVFHRIQPGAYDLKIEARGMNPMLYHLKIDHDGSRRLLMIKMPIGG